MQQIGAGNQAEDWNLAARYQTLGQSAENFKAIPCGVIHLQNQTAKAKAVNQ